MSRKPEKHLKFSENERVLCYQGPIIYEAKCLKAEVHSDGKPRYLIHYNGWNKHWDEWVAESRILKYNDDNLLKQKESLKQFNKDKLKKNKSFKGTKAEKDVPEKKKLASDQVDLMAASTFSVQEPRRKRLHLSSSSDEKMEQYQHSLDISVKMPKELKLVLADDWDLISRQKLICHLPAKYTVDAILSRFVEHKKKQCGSTDIGEVKDLVYGVRECFNVMLGSQLLYKFERPQYGNILEKYPNRCVSQIYGTPHFVRFFIKTGAILLSNPGLLLISLKTMVSSLCEILEFLKCQIDVLFDVGEYETAPAEYHRRALT